MSDIDKDDITGVDTTGHTWDGIKELNNPLPRWWLWCFYLTIIWGVLYSVAYPAWPLINGATSGFLGYSTRAEVADEITRFEEKNASLTSALAEVDLVSLSANADLNRFAAAAGASVFRNHCSQCHGSGAAGSVGYPNLRDDDWLWGGQIQQIAHTVEHGIRNETGEDPRYSEMPKFGEILESDEIEQVVEYVLQIAGQEHDAALATAGAVVYEDNCSACHGETGLGDIEQGAPNLADAIWLYGGDRETVTETVVNARFGVMPNWSPRLNKAEINAVSAYVHQLGGGE